MAFTTYEDIARESFCNFLPRIIIIIIIIIIISISIISSIIITLLLLLLLLLLIENAFSQRTRLATNETHLIVSRIQL